MCNPLTIVKPTLQLWKATSQTCSGGLIHLIKHVWRQNRICLKANGTRSIRKIYQILKD